MNDVVKCLINVSNSTDKLLNCYNPQVQSTKEFVEEHNKYNKEVILLDVVREFDKQEQVIDEINKAATDIDGAETANAPMPAPGDSYDDWD